MSDAMEGENWGKTLRRSPAKPFCSPVITDAPSVQTVANVLVSRNLFSNPWSKAAFIVGELALELSPLKRLVVKRNLVCLEACLYTRWSISSALKQQYLWGHLRAVQNIWRPEHLAKGSYQLHLPMVASFLFVLVDLCWKYLIYFPPCNATSLFRWAAFLFDISSFIRK